MKKINKLLVSTFCNGAVLAKYPFRDRTGHIEGYTGNENTFTRPLRVPDIKYWKKHEISSYSAINSSFKNNYMINEKFINQLELYIKTVKNLKYINILVHLLYMN